MKPLKNQKKCIFSCIRMSDKFRGNNIKNRAKHTAAICLCNNNFDSSIRNSVVSVTIHQKNYFKL